MTLAPEVSLATLGLALAAGVASFLSPCVLPLLPGYLSFVSGVSVGELEARNRRVLLGTLAFIAGFSLMFTLAGIGAAFLGGALLENRRILQIGGGILLIVLGIAITGMLPLGSRSGNGGRFPSGPPADSRGPSASAWLSP